jgi:hypothetical protein
MQRQAESSAGLSFGAARTSRVDPFALPARFAAIDPSADGRVREIEIDRNRVVVRRAVAGVRMRLNVPIESYLGVVVRIEPDASPACGQIAVVLAHRDPALSVTLSAAEDCDDVIADWQAWAKSLGCPLLIGNGDGSWREPMARLGALVVASPAPRRRRHSAHVKRRPKALMRRKPGRPAAAPVVHRDEREIIARS